MRWAMGRARRECQAASGHGRLKGLATCLALLACPWLRAEGGPCFLPGRALQSKGRPGRREALLALAGAAAAFSPPEAAQAFGQPADWLGWYRDPQHPGCIRKIDFEVGGGILGSFGGGGGISVSSRDGNPGCNTANAWSLKAWKAPTTFKTGSDTLLFDFSEKGGPKDVPGKCEGTGTGR
eukprot:TRINITY_DN37450_c0_g1_i1.p2 TRINITY_DN37450_c0_g1~~TRINITY_DN37450_c0_g1_i1.p2  ORF type:complete len:211 (-),score=34.26 TRINITY_DN37450_c0_g1_i1:60-602(-)